VPALIFRVEQFESTLVRISKKLKVDLTSQMRRSTARDFRITLAHVEEVRARAPRDRAGEPAPAACARKAGTPDARACTNSRARPRERRPRRRTRRRSRPRSASVPPRRQTRTRTTTSRARRGTTTARCPRSSTPTPPEACLQRRYRHAATAVSVSDCVMAPRRDDAASDDAVTTRQRPLPSPLPTPPNCLAIMGLSGWLSRGEGPGARACIYSALAPGDGLAGKRHPEKIATNTVFSWVTCAQ
jgi:hypothetical protein